MVNRAQDRQLWGQMLGLHDYSQVTTKLFKSVLSISAQITSCKNNPSLLDCILGIVMQMATKLGNVAVSGSKQCYVTIVETPPILLTIGIHIDITFSPHTKPTMNSKRLEETVYGIRHILQLTTSYTHVRLDFRYYVFNRGSLIGPSTLVSYKR